MIGTPEHHHGDRPEEQDVKGRKGMARLAAFRGARCICRRSDRGN